MQKVALSVVWMAGLMAGKLGALKDLLMVDLSGAQMVAWTDK